MKSDDKFIVSMNDLYSIFVHGFNTGANNGPFPEKHGLIDYFDNIFDDEPLIDGSGVKKKLERYKSEK